MDYKEAIEWIHSVNRFGMKLGLDNIKRLTDALGNPQNKYKIIHVAGTNGKGSVCAMTASILKEAGYKVGLYISPYLEEFNERIQINGVNIPNEDLARLATQVKSIIDGMVSSGLAHPTEFEVVTAIGLKYFEEQGVDFAVVEVGLGGRFDATNVVTPLVSVITNIGYDHMDVLGDTLPKIAFEKAGIIKRGIRVVSYPQEAEVLDVIKARCEEEGAYLSVVDLDDIRLKATSPDGQAFEYKDLKDLRICLLGEHQLLNAATAINAICYLGDYGIDIKDEAIRRGLENARWPGRLEVMKQDPYILIDGAHNPQGAGVLRKAIEDIFNYRKLVLVIGVLKDKDVDGILKTILPIANAAVLTKPDNPRALSAAELNDRVKNIMPGLKTYCEDDIESAVRKGIELTDRKDLLLMCGSLYLIGEVRKILRKM
ncbi:MAG: folylpolyglutamate synthase/dihydrofolate synthase family protein [Thermoanaerobacteraceae bacterium]|nr:folylpolyglutamate synthase/dihydrofolate synthase family protein [Thermoanaerobacteraceae bacterium]